MHHQGIQVHLDKCVSGSDCDLILSVQYPIALAVNYLLTAVAFAVLARGRPPLAVWSPRSLGA